MSSSFWTIVGLAVVISILIILFSLPVSQGITCQDGHISYSVGRGTCSWHGGER